MSDSIPVGLFRLAASVVFSAALVVGVGCAPSSMEVVHATSQAWSTDPYVSSTTKDGARKNAARVLDWPAAPTNATMVVGSSSAVVFAHPTVWSDPIGMLSKGDAVRVAQEQYYVRIQPPGLDRDHAIVDMREYVGSDSDDSFSPSWVQIEVSPRIVASGKGWVPARVLARPMDVATSTSSMKVAREAQAGGAGAKGFSQRTSRGAGGMKGVAGAVEAKEVNYEAADALLARCASPTRMPSHPFAPFSPLPRVTDLPALGQSLAVVDPGTAQASEQATREAIAVSGGGDRGGLGIPGLGGATALTQLIKEYPLTAEEERFISRESLARCIGRSEVLPASHPVSAYVQWVGSWIAAQSTLPYPASGLEFIVLDDPTSINAMAVPGGPVLITTGMLGFLESEDELAFLLGHEMAHIEERHGFAQLEKKPLVRQMASIMSLAELASSGGLDPLLQQLDLPPMAVEQIKSQIPGLVRKLNELIAETVRELIVEGGDQGIETAADIRGLSLCAAAGYDPRAAEEVLQRLKRIKGNYGGASYSDERLAETRMVIPLLPNRMGVPYDTISVAGRPVPSDKARERWMQLDSTLPTLRVTP
jgi:Zn-dependent protease with chaperone function